MISIAFLKFYGITKLEDLITALDKEQWVPVNVPQCFVSLIDIFHGTNTLETSPKGSYKQLVSDDIGYWCSGSLLLLISFICEYIQIITEIRVVAYEAFCSLIELIKVWLKINNSRCMVQNPDI